MIWYKLCPKCHGDLRRNEDMYGQYIACAQCGYNLSDPERVVLGIAVAGYGLYSLATATEEQTVA